MKNLDLPIGSGLIRLGHVSDGAIERLPLEAFLNREELLVDGLDPLRLVDGLDQIDIEQLVPVLGHVLHPSVHLTCALDTLALVGQELGRRDPAARIRPIQIEIDNKNTLIGAHRQAIRVVLQRAAVGSVGKLAVVVADRVEQFGAARS